MLLLISLTLMHHPLLILFLVLLTLTLLPLIFFLLSLLQTIFLLSFTTEFVNSPSLPFPPPPRKVWLYHLTDFECANALLFSIDWKRINTLSDSNASWAIIKELFLCIMTTTVPSKLVYHPMYTNSSFPWVIHFFINQVKIRKSIFFWFFSLGQIPFLL